MSESIIGNDPAFEVEILTDWRDPDIKAEFDGNLKTYRYYRWAERQGRIKREGAFKFNTLEDVVATMTGPLHDTTEAEHLRQVLDSQRQAASGRKRDHKARSLSYLLARKIWWDDDRETPEPRSTAGCAEIVRWIEQDGLGRYSTGTVKGWLNDADLIPDYAMKGGRPKT